MRIVGRKTVKISDLNENLFVRQSLNHDHVLGLVELIKAGTKMKDPIEVTENLDMVEGRHRKNAYEVCGVTEVEVKVIAFESDAEMIAYAYKANTGGSLPPTRSDTEHTVRLLLDRKVAMKNIANLLGLPDEVGMKYVQLVKGKIAKVKLQRAVSAVVDDGKSAPKAAEEHGVELDKLKKQLSGDRKTEKGGIPEMKKQLTSSFRSLGSTQGKMMSRLMQQFDEGEISEKQFRDVVKGVQTTHKRLAGSLQNWVARLNAKTKPGDSAAG